MSPPLQMKLFIIELVEISNICLPLTQIGKYE